MSRTLFTGGQVFDTRTATTAPADLVVEGDRIVDVGPGLDGDESIDASGRTLLPGLFDCHTHVVFSHIDLWKLMQQPFSYRFYEAEKNLRATLDIGITTIRDAGGADLGMKKALQDGLIAGPRMQISIRMLSQTGGHGDEWLPSGALAAMFVDYPGSPPALVDGPEEMRRKVRELIRNGADVIKVATSGGVLSPRDDPRHAHFRMDELEVLVSEAAAAGMWVMAHAQASDGIKNAIRAGIRSIEHGVYLDDQAVSMMLEKGTYLVPTLVAPQGVISAAEAGAQIPEASLAKAKDVVEIHRESFRKAVAAGVKVAMGTDSGVTPHGENLRELPLMVEGGMSPGQAIVATSATAAELMGVQDELGSLEPGKRADLVIVEGDVFDLKTLPERIEVVYRDGDRVIDRTGKN
ncbi:MAG TPA: amidohydrolase family protein [Actinomycetota bacterium]|nr:amidohydrolase family protein [Actinomycetota bacterium]